MEGVTKSNKPSGSKNAVIDKIHIDLFTNIIDSVQQTQPLLNTKSNTCSETGIIGYNDELINEFRMCLSSVF